MIRPQQLLLDLPHRSASGREDFLVTSANAAAVQVVDDWPNWPTHGSILIGPEGCGKTHLAEVWCQKSGAPLIDAKSLKASELPQAFSKAVLCVENCEAANLDQTTLFHLLNLAKQQHGQVLLTAKTAPAQWPISLPDLKSRLNALPQIQILPPDDTLLRGVLVKLFADRQIYVDESLINYLILRMPRSLAAARLVVEKIDQKALVERAEVTKNLAAKVLHDFAGPDLFTTD